MLGNYPGRQSVKWESMRKSGSRMTLKGRKSDQKDEETVLRESLYSLTPSGYNFVSPTDLAEAIDEHDAGRGNFDDSVF